MANLNRVAPILVDRVPFSITETIRVSYMLGGFDHNSSSCMGWIKFQDESGSGDDDAI